MRDNVRSFVAHAAAAFDLPGPVYEFGSYLVEGQDGLGDLRPLFPGRQYVGCDMRPGPGVDDVQDLAQLALADETAGTVLCVDTLEHVFEARRAVEEMIRVLAPGGVLLISAPMDFRIHNYPSDYWRLTPACIARLLAPLESAIVGWQGLDSFPHTVLGVGCKAPVGRTFLSGIARFIAAFEQSLQQAQAGVPWRKRVKQRVVGWLRSKGERRRHRDYYTARFSVRLPQAADWRAELLPAGAIAQPFGARVDLC